MNKTNPKVKQGDGMVDHWGIYGGKTREELNPHGLREGDWVITPDGIIGKLERPGFKWGYLQGRDRPYTLTELRPACRLIAAG